MYDQSAELSALYRDKRTGPSQTMLSYDDNVGQTTFQAMQVTCATPDKAASVTAHPCILWLMLHSLSDSVVGVSKVELDVSNSAMPVVAKLRTTPALFRIKRRRSTRACVCHLESGWSCQSLCNLLTRIDVSEGAKCQ